LRVANLERRRKIVGFFGGMGALFEGLGFVVATPAVWPLAVVPVLVALVLVGGCGALGIWGAIAFANHLVPGGSGALAAIGSFVLKLLLGAVAVALGGVVAMALAQPLSGFALERIARLQEQRLGGRAWPNEKLLPGMLRSMQVTFTALIFGLPILSLLFVVTFFFPPAAVVTVPLKFVVTALMIAWDFLDYPLSVRGTTVGGRLRFMGTHFTSVLGFGIASGCLLLVPGIGLLLLPVGVAGATRLVVREERLLAR
jgi:CysZ protein